MIDWHAYDIGAHRIKCVACGRNDRDKTLGLTIEHDGAGVAHCFRCGFVENYRPERGAVMFEQPRIQAPKASTKHETLSAYGHALWGECRPVSGVAEAYLTARNCRIPPKDGDLRYHAALKHPSGYVGPALVALVTDAITNEPISLHRTWVQANGKKADVEPARMLLGGHRKQGGVIRLWPDEAVTTGIGIAEGIETALSLAWAITPVWALIDAGNLADFPVLDGIDSLTIARDNDPAGIQAADACALRWADGDRRALVTQQTENDFNDSLQ